MTAPEGWYAGLAKPGLNPPGWVFPPVWTMLYILIAIAGWRIWRRDRGGHGDGALWMQLGLHFLWSPVFISAHRTGLALVVDLVLLAAIIAFIGAARRCDRVAACLFVPYAVAYASVINASILALNRSAFWRYCPRTAPGPPPADCRA